MVERADRAGRCVLQRKVTGASPSNSSRSIALLSRCGVAVAPADILRLSSPFGGASRDAATGPVQSCGVSPPAR